MSALTYIADVNSVVNTTCYLICYMQMTMMLIYANEHHIRKTTASENALEFLYTLKYGLIVRCKLMYKEILKHFQKLLNWNFRMSKIMPESIISILVICIICLSQHIALTSCIVTPRLRLTRIIASNTSHRKDLDLYPV